MNSHQYHLFACLLVTLPVCLLICLVTLHVFICCCFFPMTKSLINHTVTCVKLHSINYYHSNTKCSFLVYDMMNKAQNVEVTQVFKISFGKSDGYAALTSTI